MQEERAKILESINKILAEVSEAKKSLASLRRLKS
jgi:hypothetical protein